MRGWVRGRDEGEMRWMLHKWRPVYGLEGVRWYEREG